MGSIDILRQRAEFTQAEKERLNGLATQTAENLTYDDLELYARFKVDAALTDERFEMERQQMQELTKAKIEATNVVKDAAINKMKLRKELAKAKLAKMGGD